LGQAKKNGIGARDESPFMVETAIQDSEMREYALLARDRSIDTDRCLHIHTHQSMEAVVSAYA
jgi:hypothetical protein